MILFNFLQLPSEYQTGLKTVLKKACLWSKMSVIWMVHQVAWLFEYRTPKLSGIQMNLVFRCWVFRWLLYKFYEMDPRLLSCRVNETGFNHCIFVSGVSVSLLMTRLLSLTLTITDYSSLKQISKELNFLAKRWERKKYLNGFYSLASAEKWIQSHLC